MGERRRANRQDEEALYRYKKTFSLFDCCRSQRTAQYDSLFVMLSFSSKVLLIVLNFVRAGTMSTQAKLRKIAEAANARKGKTATASTAPTPPPSAVASPSPSLEVVGEKRGLPEVVEDQGPPKHHRGPGDSTALT
jgi:hypothetical protein